MGKNHRPSNYSAFGAIDSHAHLDRKVFEEGLETILSSAWEHDVSAIIAVASGSDPAVFETTTTCAESDSRIWACAGIHPHNAAQHEVLFPALKACLGHPRLVGLGEFGLDFHYDFSPRATQKSVFAQQLELASERNLPIVLHIREAFEESLAILDAFAPEHRGVIHCFGGSTDQAQEFLGRGFHLSIPGIVTFGPKVSQLHEAVRAIPMDRLLVETDTPYLAPHPFRGKQNNPALVAFVVAELARLKDLSAEEIAQQTRANTIQLFELV
jgi:TatD DNase family protein